MEMVSWFRYNYCTFGSTVNQPQQEPKYDMAVCHALVSRTDHKGRMGDVQTGEIQKNRVLLLGGVNDRKHGAASSGVSLQKETSGSKI